MGSFEAITPNLRGGEGDDDATGVGVRHQSPWLATQQASPCGKGQGKGGPSQGAAARKGSVDFGEYRSEKIRKLQDAGAARGHRTDVDLMFKGVHVWVDGFTNPPPMELRALIEAYGGRFEPEYNPSLVTHIVADQLAEAHVARYNKMKTCPVVVRAEWITESIAQNRLLHTAKFRHPRIGTMQGQSMLSSFVPMKGVHQPGGAEERMQDRTMMKGLVLEGGGGDAKNDVDAGRMSEQDGDGSAGDMTSLCEAWSLCVSSLRKASQRVDLAGQHVSHEHPRPVCSEKPPGSLEDHHERSEAWQPPEAREQPEARNRPVAKGGPELLVVLEVKDFLLTASLQGCTKTLPSSDNNFNLRNRPGAVVTAMHPSRGGDGMAETAEVGWSTSADGGLCASATSLFKQGDIVLEANGQALSAGVSCGMSSQEALSHCPSLVLIPLESTACARMAQKFEAAASAMGFVYERGLRGGQIFLKQRRMQESPHKQIEGLAVGSALKGLWEDAVRVSDGGRVLIGAGYSWAEALDSKQEMDCPEVVQMLAQRCTLPRDERNNACVARGWMPEVSGRRVDEQTPSRGRIGGENAGEGSTSMLGKGPAQGAPGEPSGRQTCDFVIAMSPDASFAAREARARDSLSEFLPSMSQIDPSVFEELPEDVQREVRGESAARNRLGVSGRGGGGRGRGGSAFGGQGGKRGGGKGKSINAKAWGSSRKKAAFFQSAGGDSGVVSHLHPDQIRYLEEWNGSDWVQQHVMNQAQYRRGKGSEDRGEQRKRLAGGSGKMEGPGLPDSAPPMVRAECGDLTSLRRAVCDWMSTSDRPHPVHEQALFRILDTALSVERRLDVAACLMKVLSRKGGDGGAWKEVADRVIAKGQRSILEQWGGHIHL